MEIPKANFFGRLDPEHQKGLLPDVIDPASGISMRQAETGRAELKDLLSSGDAEKLLNEYQQADAETQATPEWEKVYSELKQRYADAGEEEPVAENLATLHANAIANLAQRAGMKADELLALHNPKIVAGEAAGTTLFQSEKQIAGTDGSDAALLTPNGKLPAKYRLVEAADLVPSHNPVSFEKNPAYPEGVQERAYDKSKEAQARVIEQAQNYEPAYTVNTNPDAVNGPPVITPDGVVLGGNSRSMATIRLYRDGNGETYKSALREQAANYGLSPEDVDAMKEPVLVRQVQAPASVDAMRRLGSDLNRSMTGALGAAEKAVSAGKNIKPETLRWAADEMNAGDLSLRELLSSKGGEVLKRLVQDGAITDRERPQYADSATGGLNEAGKAFVEKAILGTVIDDPRLMESAPKGILAKLERSLGSITAFASRPDEWNILPALREAIAEHGAIQRSGSSVELRLGQTDMFAGERNPLVDALVRALDKKPNAVKEAFEAYARDSEENLPGQTRMFGSGESFDAFNHAFGSKLTSEEFRDGFEKAGGARGAGGENAIGNSDLPEASAGSARAGGAEFVGEDGGAIQQQIESLPIHPDAQAEQPRGWFRVLPDGRFEIGKTDIGDLSTFIHEPAHAYLELFRELTLVPRPCDFVIFPSNLGAPRFWNLGDRQIMRSRD